MDYDLVIEVLKKLFELLMPQEIYNSDVLQEMIHQGLSLDQEWDLIQLALKQIYKGEILSWDKSIWLLIFEHLRSSDIQVGSEAVKCFQNYFKYPEGRKYLASLSTSSFLHTYNNFLGRSLDLLLCLPYKDSSEYQTIFSRYLSQAIISGKGDVLVSASIIQFVSDFFTKKDNVYLILPFVSELKYYLLPSDPLLVSLSIDAWASISKFKQELFIQFDEEFQLITYFTPYSCKCKFNLALL